MYELFTKSLSSPCKAQTVIFGLWLSLLSASVVLSPALAQDAERRISELNRRAMEAYGNLEIDAAKRLLQEAIDLAKRERIRGTPLARTFMNFGVIHIAGLSDNAQGLEYFRRALQVDPRIQLDPLTSSPEIQEVFNLARGRGGSRSGVGQSRPSPGAGGGGGEEGNEGDGGPTRLEHTPLREQARNTPVPMFAKVRGGQNVSHVYLFYKSTGMTEFRRVEMQQVSGGWGYEIPCSDVFEPKIEYYMLALAPSGSPIAYAGSPDEPLAVPIVRTRRGPAPTIPGQPVPVSCSAEECPPGMPGCGLGGGGTLVGLGGVCTTTAECRSGLLCEHGVCTVAQEQGTDGPNQFGDAPRFFVRLGPTLGAAYVNKGMTADREPAGGIGGGGFIMRGADCDADWCVQVQTPGFVAALAMRLVAGYYLSNHLALAATARFQFSAGEGTLANLLLGARLHYLLTDPGPDGFLASFHAGGAFGQIQVQPPQDMGEGPFVISGLGAIETGASLGYRFFKNLAVVLTPEFVFLLPEFLFVVDTTLGVEVNF